MFSHRHCELLVLSYCSQPELVVAALSPVFLTPVRCSEIRVFVRFIDILRAVDFEPTVDHCLFGLGNCDTQNPCPLHSEWSVLKGQIEQWARSHTLGDSLKGKQDT